MKNIFCVALLMGILPVLAQDHFAGINTSQRVSWINAQINPAELADVTSKYEIHVFSASINASNNKIGFSDLVGGSNFEDLIFRGEERVNFRVDAELNGPAFAYKYEEWSFGIATRAYAKMDMVDIDPRIGDAITTAGNSGILATTVVSNNYNQRLSGTSYGEVALSAARNLFDSDKHRLNGGLSLKLLFPGSYANFGADAFSGTINSGIGNATLTDANANLNIAYSGNLGENFTDFSDYSNSLFGKLNGFAVDFGVNYQLKDNTAGTYKLKAGIGFRNIGSMTFTDSNNASTNYVLSIGENESLDLDQFEGTESLEEVEAILLSSGYLNKTENNNAEFKVKTPAVFSAYADFRIVPRWFVTLMAKQKLNKDDENLQIATQNFISLTPRFTMENFEAWTTFSQNEISGFVGGLGVRAYGFFIGSGSVITALISDTEQADIYIGYSFGL